MHPQAPNFFLIAPLLLLHKLFSLAGLSSMYETSSRSLCMHLPFCTYNFNRWQSSCRILEFLCDKQPKVTFLPAFLIYYPVCIFEMIIEEPVAEF